jgi:TonB dependent receptor/Carboxypeptidase regulatory-like domain
MFIDRCRSRLGRPVFAGLLLILFSVIGAAAQTSTGTIRGTVRDSAGTPVGDAEVVIRNIETGVQRVVTTRATGVYILPGLVPGGYDLTARRIGMGGETRRIQMLIGQNLEINFTLTPRTVQIEELTVLAPRPVVETKTSEVATNVTQQQINDLPTSDRNFLDLAVLAPGTALQNDRIDGTRKTFTAGAQGADNINVFIDGASYKNDILQGGVAGQDASRGNPFPRNAIQEFRILTQNFKAEYQKASSAIITAATRSGGNTWTGNAFITYQDRGLVALDTFQSVIADTNSSFEKPEYSRYLFGLSAGGPIIRDRLHFFGSFEVNRQNRAARVNIVPPAGFPALDSIDFASRNGDFGQPFRAFLGFGKLTYAMGPRSAVELSYNHRTENDIRDFGNLVAFETGTRMDNDVNTGILKHRYFSGYWLNEATVSYQRYRFNPKPNLDNDEVNRFFGFGCCAEIGGNRSIQDFTQKRLSLRNDVSWSGWQMAGSHIIKAGVNLDFLDYNIIKRNSENPRFIYEAFADSFGTPDRVEFQRGDPNFSASNKQLGLFIQDDWAPTSRLTLNIGVRWDYETNMLDPDFVTPQNIVDSLTKYADSLFIPLDPDRYFTDGNQRSPFKGAIQPRLGFSYGLTQSGSTTIFGGFGVYYDRTLFDHTLEESFALQHPNFTVRFRPAGDTTSGRIDFDPAYLQPGGVDALVGTPGVNPEVKLIPNDLKPPKSHQYSFGVRQLLGNFAISAAYTGVRSFNQVTFYWADQNFVCPERSFGVGGCFVDRVIPGFGTILFMENAGKSWYNALQIQVDRPYSRSAESNIGWGVGLAYTYAKRETEGFNDLFSFPNPVDYPKQVRNDERHRVVANFVVDVPYAFGVQFSGLVTLGSGTDLDVGDRFGGTTNPLDPGGFDVPAFKRVDLRLRKDFPMIRGTRLGISVDLFNAFNSQNLGGFNTFNPNDSNFGLANSTISDPRRLQFGAEYEF